MPECGGSPKSILQKLIISGIPRLPGKADAIAGGGGLGT